MADPTIDTIEARARATFEGTRGAVPAGRLSADVLHLVAHCRALEARLDEKLDIDELIASRVSDQEKQAFAAEVTKLQAENAKLRAAVEGLGESIRIINALAALEEKS